MTAEPLAGATARVLERIARAELLFCFLDYDGTLAPLASTPEEARPLPGTLELLRDLVDARGTAVALVSGRSIANLRRFVDVAGAYYVGVHGLETQRPDGALDVSEGVAVLRSVLPAIRQHLESELGARPGILFEDKGAALACHYRLASRADAAAARWTVSSVARRYQGRGVKIAVIEGHEVSEIRPAYANKGKAVRALLALHGQGALPLYAGDDRTDEDAFAMLPPAAITIRVGPAEVDTMARFRLAGPEEVAAFLRQVLEARRA